MFSFISQFSLLIVTATGGLAGARGRPTRARLPRAVRRHLLALAWALSQLCSSFLSLSAGGFWGPHGLSV